MKAMDSQEEVDQRHSPQWNDWERCLLRGRETLSIESGVQHHHLYANNRLLLRKARSCSIFYITLEF